MDITKALETLNGFIANPDANVEGPFFTGGPTSPVGLDLPERTVYFQNISGGCIFWRKFGTGVNDWRQLSAEDIPFDVSNLLTDSADLTGLTQTQETIEALANRNFGKDFAESTRQDSQTVTGSSFVVRDSVSFNASGGGTNKYRFAFNWTYSHDSQANDVRFQFFLDNSQVGQEVREEPKDQNQNQRFVRYKTIYEIDLADGTHTIDMRFRPATASRETTVHYSNIEVWRVE